MTPRYDRNRTGLRSNSEEYSRGRFTKKCKAIFRENDLGKTDKKRKVL